MIEPEFFSTAHFSEVFIFNLPLFPGKPLFKNAFIEDFLDFKWLVERDCSLYFLFALFLAFLRANN